MSNAFSRRTLVRFGAGGISLWYSRALAAEPAAGPHFFIQIHLNSGADSLYLFDGRPLAMTESRIVQNYTMAEPEVWNGSNGETAQAYSTMAPLKAVQNDFSVIRGIHGLVDSVSHDQNVNTLMAANAFGGDWFAPGMVASDNAEPAPLGFVQMGTLFAANFKNKGQGIILNGSQFGVNPFTNVADTRIEGTSLDPSAAFVASRFQAAMGGTGLFSKGAAAARSGFASIPSLEKAMRETTSPSSASPALANAGKFGSDVAATLGFFRGGVTQTALIVYEPSNSRTFDSHSPESAKSQPQVFMQFAENLRDLIKLLKDTPFDGSRSFFDVTTVMVETDFSRTMVSDSDRNSANLNVAATGSDHNPLTNTVILAGKGIRGGLIVGGTDFESVEAYANPSGAHLQKDPRKNCIMGSVFDFATQRSTPEAKPTIYQAADYLNVASVVNTVMKAFGRSDDAMRTLPSGGVTAKAPVLKSLLT